MRDIFADDTLTAKFFNLTENATEQDRCYVYRIKDSKPVRPAILICVPHPALFDDLRDEHGGGDFQVMIRRGETMMLSACCVLRNQYGDGLKAKRQTMVSIIPIRLHPQQGHKHQAKL